MMKNISLAKALPNRFIFFQFENIFFVKVINKMDSIEAFYDHEIEFDKYNLKWGDRPQVAVCVKALETKNNLYYCDVYKPKNIWFDLLREIKMKNYPFILPIKEFWVYNGLLYVIRDKFKILKPTEIRNTDLETIKIISYNCSKFLKFIINRNYSAFYHANANIMTNDFRYYQIHSIYKKVNRYNNMFYGVSHVIEQISAFIGNQLYYIIFNIEDDERIFEIFEEFKYKRRSIEELNLSRDLKPF